MKLQSTLILVVSLFATSTAIAQHEGMSGMEGMAGMEGMENAPASAVQKKSAEQKKITHQTAAVVQAVDKKKRTVMLAHEPVASLGWPAMTMGFQVEDKSLFAKLIVGKKVTVEFVQQGKQYVITAVR